MDAVKFIKERARMWCAYEKWRIINERRMDLPKMRQG